MTTDLHLLPLHRRAGEDTTDPLPGLHLATPPRKAARSRQTDQLILHLAFTGTATLNADTQDQLLQRLTETYYQTSGAATSALRALVEALNTFLLDRNLRAEGKGLQTAGLLTALVLRQDQLLIAQSGPTHVFTVEETQYQHLHNPQTAGHGLGLGKVAGLLINYLTPQPGTLLLVSPAPPAAWNNPALQSAFGRPLKTVQRGLLKPAGPDLNALLIQLQTGTGKVIVHKTAPVETVSSKPLAVSSERLAVSSDEGTSDQTMSGEVEPEQDTPAPAELPTPADYPTTDEPDLEPAEGIVTPPESQPEETVSCELLAVSHEPLAVSSPPPVTQTPTHTQTPPPPPPQRPSRTPPKRITNHESRITNLRSSLGPALLAIARATREALRQLGYTLRSLLTRLLPGNELFNIPSNTMAFIAIAIPILLSIIAFFVYNQRGLTSQFQTNLQCAETYRAEAQKKLDALTARPDWENALHCLDLAEQYQTTEQTTTLRLEAQSVLDQLDVTVRVAFTPVLTTPLADDVVISRMAASADNLYLLNRDGGNVVRVWQSGRGYETDQTFRCGPLPNESLIVGPIIDLAVLPPVNYLDAQVMGMDANGILVYCINETDAPIPIPLFPPDSNWGNPIAFALDEDVLYVLDPQTNAVWVYYGDNYEFSSRPRLFFDADVPPMTDVIDLAVDRGELYLLHKDGHITLCTFGFDVQPTRCTDPSPFTDARLGMENGPLLTGTQFAEIAFTPPPDPSIYMLDPLTQAVYHLSLRLTLQRQYRPQVNEDFPKTAPTAFVISPNRILYLAFGNQVWVAALP